MWFFTDGSSEHRELAEGDVLLAGMHVAVVDGALGDRSWEGDLEGAEVREAVDVDGGRVDTVEVADAFGGDDAVGRDGPVGGVGGADDVDGQPEGPAFLERTRVA